MHAELHIGRRCNQRRQKARTGEAIGHGRPVGRRLVGAAGQYAAGADSASTNHTKKGRCDHEPSVTFLRREDAGGTAMATDGLQVDHLICRAGPTRSTANADPLPDPGGTMPGGSRRATHDGAAVFQARPALPLVGVGASE